MTTEHLRARTKQFALRVLKLVDAIPLRTAGCRAIANQLARSGTAVGANYRAACKARSRAEFVAKIGIVEKADESAYWMELIIEGGILKASLVTALYNESLELVAIMAASRTTAAKALRRNNRQSAIGNRQ